MSQLTAVDISDSDRFELAEVLKEESESSSAPRPLEDILQETCDDDFVGFRPARNSPFPSSIERGEFVFVEVKSCMNDFKSGHGLTFRGDANWLVCPPDLAQTLYETRQLPKDAAVFCPDAHGRLLKKWLC